MNQPPKTYKRIVTKGKYIKAQGQRVILTLFALCVCVCGMGIAGVMVCNYLAQTHNQQAWRAAPSHKVTNASYHLASFWHSKGADQHDLRVSPNDNVVILNFVLMSLVVYVFFSLVARIRKEVQRIDPGVPLTRANTAELPAPESLVRASSEPVQDQQTVLMRAATQTQERHEAQLVRASAGGAE